MTFNGISWGSVDSKQAARYSYNAQEIIRMLNSCASGGGNLLLNIGPAPDGSVPEEAVEPLTEVGEWLKLNGKAVYGKMTRTGSTVAGGNGLCGCSLSGNSVYLWNWIWPSGGTMAVGGYKTAPNPYAMSMTEHRWNLSIKDTVLYLKTCLKLVRLLQPVSRSWKWNLTAPRNTALPATIRSCTEAVKSPRKGSDV